MIDALPKMGCVGHDCRTCEWNPMSAPPDKAGRYLVGRSSDQEVCEARYQPRVKKWTYPSGARAYFGPTHWRHMPRGPLPTE